MLNNPALLLFRSLDEDCLHFIAGTGKTNFQLSTNELDYYRVDINGHRTSQQINSLTWNAGDRVRIIKKKKLWELVQHSWLTTDRHDLCWSTIRM